MKQPMQFKREIGVGDLIHIVAMFGLVIGVYYKFDARIAATEEKSAEHAAALKELVKTTESLVVSTTRLEERTRRN